jgi:hypothetical protein
MCLLLLLLLLGMGVLGVRMLLQLVRRVLVQLAVAAAARRSHALRLI